MVFVGLTDSSQRLEGQVYQYSIGHWFKLGKVLNFFQKGCYWLRRFITTVLWRQLRGQPLPYRSWYFFLVILRIHLCLVLCHFGSDTYMKPNFLLFLLQSSHLVAHATELEDLLLLLFLGVFCCETVNSPWVSCISANLESKAPSAHCFASSL